MPEEDRLHFSRSVAQILQDNYEELSQLDGFDAEQVDGYIAEALTGAGAEAVARQVDLLNATEIMLGADGMDADYHLVWNMGHGSNEGTSTGTFIDWINEICAG